MYRNHSFPHQAYAVKDSSIFFTSGFRNVQSMSGSNVPFSSSSLTNPPSGGYVSQTSLFPTASTSNPSTSATNEELMTLVTQLTDPDKRENCLLDLSKKVSKSYIFDFQIALFENDFDTKESYFEA